MFLSQPRSVIPAMPPLIRQLSNARSRYFLTSSGLNLEYRQKGDPFAETIVMLHGMGTDCRIFLPNIDPLAESFQVIAVSIRGHGLSDKPKTLNPDSFTLDLLVRDLIELTWSLGIQSFHLVGHGLGAMLGYELLRRDPGSLLSITAMAAPAATEGAKGAIKLLQKATGFSSRLLGNHKKTSEAVAKMCSTNEEVIAYLKDEVFYATNWEIGKLLKPHHTGVNYLSILQENEEIPVLFLMGMDPAVEKLLGSYRAMGSSLLALEAFKHIQVQTIGNTGYFPNLDSPREFHQVLSSFINIASS